MIAYLKGKLAHKEPSIAIVECNGVGYECKISLNTYSKLGNSEAVHLFTYLQVREDAQILFGFADPAEKALFEQLISISGVGGNTALTILSSIAPKELEHAIQTENVDALQRVKGIGKKTAGRIILELKGKLKLGDDASDTSSSDFGNRRQEALSALISLGFPKAAMEKKIESILSKSPEATVEEIIRLALKG